MHFGRPTQEWFITTLVITQLACSRGAKTPDAEALTPARRAVAEAVVPPFLGVEQCYNAWDDNENGLLDEGCAVAQSAVVVMLSWAEPDVDLDLLVTDPHGELATAHAPTKSGLVMSFDCPTDDDCPDHPYELALVEEERYLGGKYEVRVLATDLLDTARPLVAHLGIRTPEGTRAFRLEFFDSGQSAALDFVVARPAQNE